MLSTLRRCKTLISVVGLLAVSNSWAFILGPPAPRAGFTAVRDHGVAWLIGPDGKRLWSFGVCVVDTGVKFDEYDERNPAYSAWRFYPSKPAWATDAIKILESGGFNTIGAWSDYSALLGAPDNRLYMTPIIHSGSSAGFPWLDMWDPTLVKVADDVTKGLIQSLKNDPRIIGYFSDNELGWWKPAVYDWIWKQKTLFTREKTVQVFRRHYAGSWANFAREFDVVDAKSWSQLSKKGHPYLRPDARGQAALSEVLTMLAERYYSLCSSLVKKYAPNALYLGDRYISNYYPEVASVAGKYCDVVSTNLNPDFKNGSFVHFYLQGLEALTHKPLMITEYYMTSREGRSGNGNDRSGFPVVDTLAERSDGFARTTTDLLRNPDVVGAHWFQYYDEPKNGRGDGENYNFGLVDTSNHPYAELLSRGKSLDLDAEHASALANPIVSELSASAWTSDDITTWDGVTGFISPEQTTPRGELFAAWSPAKVKLGMIWPEERFGENYFRDGKIPSEDETSIEITIGGKRTVLRIDPSSKTVQVPTGWRAVVEPGTTSHLILEIPAKAFSQEPLRIGSSVNLSLKLVSECHAYTTSWRVGNSN